MRKAAILAVMAVFVSAGILVASTSAASAMKPPRIPGWHDGEIVTFTVVNENVEGVDRDVPAIPFYVFGEPGNQPQADVLSAIPGNPDYNPWWDVIVVIPLDGRDLTVKPYTSEDEILAAEAAGAVVTIDVPFVFLCQVLPGKGNRP